jgi:hypothetical protein
MPLMVRARDLLLALVLLAGPAAPGAAAEPPALVKARALYNAADYDGAITAATEARTMPEWADLSALVLARAHLERYRQHANADDLAAAGAALDAVRAAALPPREHLDLLVGMGQFLYLSGTFGASAEMFDSALAQAFLLNGRERLLLLDWWANAMDRAAQARPPDARAVMFERVIERMEDELRSDPANPVANYWLPLAARGRGDLERAWDAAIAGWVRSRLWPETAADVREDLDRLVVQVLIPERARARGGRDAQDVTKAMLEEWEGIKQQWSVGPPPVPADP